MVYTKAQLKSNGAKASLCLQLLIHFVNRLKTCLVLYSCSKYSFCETINTIK